MKLNKKIGFIFLILAVTFAPLSFSNMLVKSQDSSYEEVGGYEEWTTDRTISGVININPEATVIVKNGTTLTFNGG